MTSPAPLPLSTPLHIVPPCDGIDPAYAERAGRRLPGRARRGYGHRDGGPPADGPRLRRHATPRSFDLTTVANAENYDELVARPRHPVHWVRGHRMLSFLGTTHVGSLPGNGFVVPPGERCTAHCSCDPGDRTGAAQLPHPGDAGQRPP